VKCTLVSPLVLVVEVEKTGLYDVIAGEYIRSLTYEDFQSGRNIEERARDSTNNPRLVLVLHRLLPFITPRPI
jgi:hypothetical protein